MFKQKTTGCRLVCAAVMLLCCAMTAHAQTRVVTYTLENVFFTPTRQMTGTFTWTYEEGDFENGTGVFSEVYIPYYWSDLEELIITIELNQIEFTFDGNLHDRGLDVTLFLLEPLSSTQPSTIDTTRSRYQVEVGIIYEGFIDSGSIVPAGPCAVDLTADGILDFFDAAAFLNAFASHEPIADWNTDSVFDFFDVAAFLDDFSAGCP